MNQRNPHSGSAFQAIRAIDYTVIFARDMVAMRRFYEDILGFPLQRELSPDWIEYRVGNNTLALARPKRTAGDVPTPDGSASLQLAFKVSAPEVDQCADELVRQGVDLLSPRTNQVFGHRTLFFRDPDPGDSANAAGRAPIPGGGNFRNFRKRLTNLSVVLLSHSRGAPQWRFPQFPQFPQALRQSARSRFGVYFDKTDSFLSVIRPLSSARDGGLRSSRSLRKRYANQHPSNPFDFAQGKPFDFARGQRAVCAAGHAGAWRRIAGLPIAWPVWPWCRGSPVSVSDPLTKVVNYACNIFFDLNAEIIAHRVAQNSGPVRWQCNRRPASPPAGGFFTSSPVARPQP